MVHYIITFTSLTMFLLFHLSMCLFILFHIESIGVDMQKTIYRSSYKMLLLSYINSTGFESSPFFLA